MRHLCECGRPAIWKYPVGTLSSTNGRRTGYLYVCDSCLHLEIADNSAVPYGLARVSQPLARPVTLAERIVAHLRIEKNATVAELAVALDVSEGAIRSTLRNDSRFTSVRTYRRRNHGGKRINVWGLSK